MKSSKTLNDVIKKIRKWKEDRSGETLRLKAHPLKLWIIFFYQIYVTMMSTNEIVHNNKKLTNTNTFTCYDKTSLSCARTVILHGSKICWVRQNDNYDTRLRRIGRKSNFTPFSQCQMENLFQLIIQNLRVVSDFTEKCVLFQCHFIIISVITQQKPDLYYPVLSFLDIPRLIRFDTIEQILRHSISCLFLVSIPTACFTKTKNLIKTPERRFHENY